MDKMKTKMFIAAMLCAAMASALTGCSKDNEDLIVGTWAVSQTSYTSIGDNQVVAVGDISGQDWQFCFKSDHTGWINNPPDYVPYTYTIKGDDLILRIPTRTYGVRKSRDYDELAFKIDQLDENKLVVAEETVWHDIDVIYRLHMSKF